MNLFIELTQTVLFTPARLLAQAEMDNAVASLEVRRAGLLVARAAGDLQALTQ